MVWFTLITKMNFNMKNKFDLQREIRRVEEEVIEARSGKDKKTERSGLKTLEFLRQVKAYLETEPTEDYLRKTL